MMFQQTTPKVLLVWLALKAADEMTQDSLQQAEPVQGTTQAVLAAICTHMHTRKERPTTT
jgi:hypothetical protein